MVVKRPPCGGGSLIRLVDVFIIGVYSLLYSVYSMCIPTF